MSALGLSLGVVLGVASAHDASSPDAALAEARGAVQRGNATLAAQGYVQAASLLPACGDLEYNAGTAAAEAEQVGAAVLHLERALRESPWDGDARQNLERVRQKRIDKVMGQEPGELPLQRLALGLPGRLLFWLALCAWWAGFALWLWSSVRRRRLVVSLIVLAIVCEGLSLAFQSERAVPYAIVTGDGATPSAGLKVHAGPAADLPTSFEVHEGLKVLILDTENGFAHVRLGNGLEGYVPEGSVEAI